MLIFVLHFTASLTILPIKDQNLLSICTHKKRTNSVHCYSMNHKEYMQNTKTLI